MDLVIVAFYTLCDDLLIEHGYPDDPRAIALIPALVARTVRCRWHGVYSRMMLSKARFNRRLHCFRHSLNQLPQTVKPKTQTNSMSSTQYPVPVCTPLHSNAKLYQGESGAGG